MGIYEYYINFVIDVILISVAILNNLLFIYQNGIHISAFCLLLTAIVRQLCFQLIKRINSLIHFRKAMNLLYSVLFYLL